MMRHLDSVCENGRFHGENQKEIVIGAVSTVLVVKRINPKIHFQFVKSFGACVEQIWGYRQVRDLAVVCVRKALGKGVSNLFLSGYRRVCHLSSYK